MQKIEIYVLSPTVLWKGLVFKYDKAYFPVSFGHSFFWSYQHLDYTYPTRLEKLFKLQKKILRIITFLSYTAPSLPLFKKLHLLNMYQINDLLIASFSFSLNNNVLPPYFDDVCIENFKVHSYNTRGSKQLHKTFNRTNYGKYRTKEKIIKIWNEIPKAIKCSASLKIFKTKMKQFIFQKWYWYRSYFVNRLLR